jgi:hypothetical protein
MAACKKKKKGEKDRGNRYYKLDSSRLEQIDLSGLTLV